MFTLDDDPFPKGDPDARQLMDIVATRYTDERLSFRLVAPFDIRAIDIQPGLAPRDRWDVLLDELARRGKLRAFVQVVHDEFPGNSQVPFLKKLLFRYPGESFDLSAHLDLFDRVDETKLLSQGLRGFKVPPEIDPIVVVILAEVEDEYTLFVRQANASVLGRFLSGGAQEPETVRWATNPKITAESELRDLAGKKIGDEDSDLDDVIKRLGRALAGKPISIMIRSRDLSEQAGEGKLKQFLSLWGRLGRHSPPAILYLSIVRWHDSDPSLDRAHALVWSALQNANNSLTTLEPIMLSACDLAHFDDWRSTLDSIGKKIHPAKYAAIWRYFQLRPAFRLRELKHFLEGI